MKADSAASAPPDDELVERSRGGDTKAFETLYRRHAARVHALCWRLCGGNEATAQDLTQETFVRAWRSLDGFRGRAAFRTWLHRVAVNVALGEKRSRLRLAETGLEQAPEPHTVPTTGHAMDLEQAVARLPERARHVFVLHAVEGYAHREIAGLTGMAEGSSKAHLHRARQLLREYLET